METSVTIKQTQAFLQVSKRQVYNLIKDGKLIKENKGISIPSVLNLIKNNDVKVELDKVDLQIKQLKYDEMRGQLLDINHAMKLGTQLGSIVVTALDDYGEILKGKVTKKVQSQLENLRNDTRNSIELELKKIELE